MNLGQLRRNNITDYTTPLTYTIIDVDTEASLSEIIIFRDRAIQLSGSNVLTLGNNYYLNFQLHRNYSSDYVVKVYLKNTNQTEDNTQYINSYTISQGVPSQTVPLEMIINPNGTYDQIVFEIQRDASDYAQKNADGTYGRLVVVDVDNLEEIYNTLTYIGHTPLKKMGIQGPPGLLMCINGEEIRIGRSGIYEILADYDINFMGFIIKSSSQTASGTDYFVMDYQY